MYQVEENPVKIKTLSVGKLKFTKSLFKQVLFSKPFNNNIEFLGKSFFGFVYTDDRRYLIWIKDKELRQYDLTYLIRISNIHKETRFNYEIEDSLKRFGINLNKEEHSSEFPWLGVKKDDEARLLLMIENADKFLKQVSLHQIYL